MDTKGTHLIAEYWGCHPNILNDVEQLRTAMFVAVGIAQATAVNSVFHTFPHQGVTGVVVVEESHFAIHTCPEEGYAACDFFTRQRDCDLMAAHNVMVEVLGVDRWHLLEIDRGHPLDGLRANALASPENP